jgi:hypothetical protein
MKKEHLIWLAIGAAVGYFVLPMVVSTVRGAMAKQSSGG